MNEHLFDFDCFDVIRLKDDHNLNLMIFFKNWHSNVLKFNLVYMIAFYYCLMVTK